MNQVYLAKTLFEAHYAGVGFLYETAKQEAAAPGPCAHGTLNQSTWRAWAECSLQEIRAPESVPGEKSLQDGKREGKPQRGSPPWLCLSSSAGSVVQLREEELLAEHRTGTGRGAAAPCEAPVKCPALAQLPGASWATGATSPTFSRAQTPCQV